MSRLMDLPAELLCQILEEVGGSQLRRGYGSASLCVSRKWYAAARPVYLSGLEVAKVNIFGHNLTDLDTKYSYSGLRLLMHKNTRKLRVRLLGHYWDEASSGDPGGHGDDLNEPPFDFEMPGHVAALEVWRDNTLRPHVNSLFADLSNFEALETLKFEATADAEAGHERGPHWNYLYQSTVLAFLHNLPIAHDLKYLTLDISGLRNGVLNDVDGDTHFCTSIANVLPRVENVRLRMHTLCPTIFDIDEALSNHAIKLQTLIIKLHLPSFFHTIEARIQPCPQMRGARTSQALLQTLARNSDVFLKKLARLQQTESHGMTGFRISFAFPRTPSISTLDCLTMKLQSLPEEYFLYEDDGMPDWYELKQAYRMLNGGDFRYNNRV